MDAKARDAEWRRVLSAGDLPGATRFLGWEFLDLDAEAGWCEAAFHPPAEALNPGGAVQGGFISAMLDEVMSVAACVIQPEFGMAPTLQMTTNFLRPVPAARLIGRGAVVRAGRRAVHTEGWLRDEDGALLAQAVAACIPRPMTGAYGG